jgi:hypothetical protein
LLTKVEIAPEASSVWLVLAKAAVSLNSCSGRVACQLLLIN